MKVLLLILAFAFSISASAQSFFKPLPRPTASTKLGVAANPNIQNNFRPLVGVTALFSDGTSLAGGVGAGLMHNKWDEASQSWVTQYSISGLVFLDTQAGITGAVAFGFLNLFSVGGGYNFTTQKFELLTGITLKPF
jgi:hypothetical protein